MSGNISESGFYLRQDPLGYRQLRKNEFAMRPTYCAMGHTKIANASPYKLEPSGMTQTCSGMLQ